MSDEINDDLAEFVCPVRWLDGVVGSGRGPRGILLAVVDELL